MVIKTCAYPRAALIGNPSDGYFGKTIAFTFANFQADITLFPTRQLEILPGKRDHVRFDGLEHLYNDVKQYGYYGGFRLIKAALKKFHEYCREQGLKIEKRNFTIRYHSSIPLHLGLAGSSAIITACLQAVMEYYQVKIEPAELASLVLSVETEELGIGGGLQDRVAQAFQGLVYMDFERSYMEKHGKGKYEQLEKADFHFYIAYKTSLSESSETVHNDLRYRYNNNESVVVEAMKQFAVITDKFKAAYQSADISMMNTLLDSNFDLRASICRISKENRDMIDIARRHTVSAKFTGSGGAIIGLYRDEEHFWELKRAFEGKDIAVIKPLIV
jgi:glucuronokinase